MNLVISLLVGGLGIVLVAKLLPGFHVRGGFVSAVLVAGVYGLLKAGLQSLMIVMTFPFVLLSLGLFILVINAFLLWVTDKLMRRFEVESLGQLLLGSVLLSVFDYGAHILLRQGSVL